MLFSLSLSPPMPVVAFSFGSFGDIAAILQLAYTIRRALSETAGASAEIADLIEHIDSFTRALHQIKAALAALDGVQSGLANGVAHALDICFRALHRVQTIIDAFHSKMSTAVGAAVWRRYWAICAWEILGGSREVDTLKRRMSEQLQIVQTLLAVSQRCVVRAFRRSGLVNLSPVGHFSVTPSPRLLHSRSLTQLGAHNRPSRSSRSQ